MYAQLAAAALVLWQNLCGEQILICSGIDPKRNITFFVGAQKNLTVGSINCNGPD